MLTHTQFITKHLGRFVDIDGYPKDQPFQCMDLMRFYVKEVYGLDPYKVIPAAPTAKLCFQNFKENAYFSKVINGKYNIPKKGDIVFWGFYPTVTGWAGHVAIFDSGDLYTVISFDQNYPTGKPCLMVKHGSSKIFHGYRGVMGWLARK
jgi:hypothetical protein